MDKIPLKYAHLVDKVITFGYGHLVQNCIGKEVEMAFPQAIETHVSFPGFFVRSVLVWNLHSSQVVACLISSNPTNHGTKEAQQTSCPANHLDIGPGTCTPSRYAHEKTFRLFGCFHNIFLTWSKLYNVNSKLFHWNGQKKPR